MSKTSNTNPPGDLEKEPLIIIQSRKIGDALRQAPWWLIAIFLISILVAILILSNPVYSEVFNFTKGRLFDRYNNFVPTGLALTIITSLAAYSVALVLGLFAGLGRISKNLVINNIATFYVEVVRGIPMLVLIFYIALVGVPTVVDGLNGLGELFIGIDRLTISPDLNTQPAWSPDGDLIAYSALNQENEWTDIVLITSDGEETRRLTHTANANYFPVWSPDGQALAFMSESPNLNIDIYLVDRDGNNLRPLVETPLDEIYPVWSSDGQHIAFLAERDDSQFDLFMINSDGSDLMRLNGDTAAYARKGMDFPNLSWSLDGNQIAFMSEGDDGDVDIYVAHTDGSGVTRLTQSKGDDLFPVWSPDGKRIAFTSRRGGIYTNIYTMDVDGENVVRLTNVEADDQDLNWSPDGQSIAFVSRREDNIDIYVVSIDGSEERRLLNSQGVDKSPDWSPDGTRIVFTGVRVSNPDIFTISLQPGFLAPIGRPLTLFDNQSVPLNFRAIVALAVTYGAFLAEIFRAGIQSIGRGQMEAARSLGMSNWQAMRHIILPQAIRNVLPALGNDFVAMVKDSSMVSVLAVRDVTQLARLYAGTSFRYREAYTILAVLYLSMTVVLSLLVRVLERRLRKDE